MTIGDGRLGMLASLAALAVTAIIALGLAASASATHFEGHDPFPTEPGAPEVQRGATVVADGAGTVVSCCKGDHTLRFDIERDRETDYFEYEMENVIISSVETGGSSSGDQLPEEDISFSFSREGEVEGGGDGGTSGQVTTPPGLVIDIGAGDEDETGE